MLIRVCFLPWEQPRVRGEKGKHRRVVPDFLGTTPGTTPRARGKACGGRIASGQGWANPACAGKLLNPWLLCSVPGNNPAYAGKGCWCPPDVPCVGNNPAYAGKRRGAHKSRRGFREQPRVRGEKAAMSSRRGISAGTTPRARGKAEDLHLVAGQPGNNPAYAGKRLRDQRVCGCTIEFSFNLHALRYSGTPPCTTRNSGTSPPPPEPPPPTPTPLTPRPGRGRRRSGVGRGRGRSSRYRPRQLPRARGG